MSIHNHKIYYIHYATTHSQLMEKYEKNLFDMEMYLEKTKSRIKSYLILFFL